MNAPCARRLEGSCHCGSIRVALNWPEAEPTIPVAACGCDFCARHRAAWTSHPRGRFHLRTADGARVTLVQAGPKGTDCHVCATCGLMPIKTRVMNGARYAVINATALYDLKGLRPVQAAVRFEGETNEARVGWWWRNWTPEAAGGEA